jgi:hypothetical protein
MSRNFIATATLIAASLIACASQEETEADLGAVGLNVTTAPSDVNCLVIQATGSGRTVTRSISVTPGQAIVTPIDGLPTGTVNVSAYAYASVCASVTASSPANWISDPVSQTVSLSKGTIVPLDLVLRPNGGLLPRVDFLDDAAAGAGGMTGVGGASGSGGSTGGTTGVGGSPATCNDMSAFTGVVNTQFGYAYVPVTNSAKRYVMSANWWGAYAGQVENVTGIGFMIPAQNAQSASSAPLGFPQLYIGSVGGRDASAGANLPRLVSAVASAPVVFQSNMTSTLGTNIADVIEAWFTPTTAPGNYTPGAGGAILRLWLHKPEARQPVGALVATVTIAGGSWNVWLDKTNPPAVTYVSSSPLSGITTDLKPFIAHAVSSAYGVTSTQYLSAIMGGFEIWSGGSGLALKQFCAQVN